MPGLMHIVMGKLSWETLSPEDQRGWGLSAEVPADTPEFLRQPPMPKTVAEKMGRYAQFLDRMGWRGDNLRKHPEFALEDGRPVPHGAATPDLNGCWSGEQLPDAEGTRRLFRRFVPPMIEEVRRGDMERAALFGGLITHVIQDGAALSHVFPNAMFYDFFPDDGETFPDFHGLIDGCDPALDRVTPALLGTRVEEVVFRLGVNFERNVERFKRAFIPMIEAGRQDDRETMNALARPFLQNAVWQVASLYHSALAIGRGPMDPREAAALAAYDLTEAVPHTCHPGNGYRKIVRGASVDDGRRVPLRADLGAGPVTVERGLGMTSFVTARYLLEPGAFTHAEGMVTLSCDYPRDQEPDMDVAFFIGLDRDYNRLVTPNLDYGPGMKKVWTVKLTPGMTAQRFAVPLGDAQTLLLAALPEPVWRDDKERCWFPHIVVIEPRLTKRGEGSDS